MNWTMQSHNYHDQTPHTTHKGRVRHSTQSIRRCSRPLYSYNQQHPATTSTTITRPWPANSRTPRTPPHTTTPGPITGPDAAGMPQWLFQNPIVCHNHPRNRLTAPASTHSPRISTPRTAQYYQPRQHDHAMTTTTPPKAGR